MGCCEFIILSLQRSHKVCAVDVSKISSHHVASAAYDRAIKV
ncbi:hypothetical protein SLEP1_g13257 [Rubroshorea leprosula]|uniref:Uncharacterized protein n=1 Tax=Rubroshorea leprosula TaxID=152421 RepID=A0AAV5IPW8_9ROSI|nr:hypothetical protein SLEP1_g13257 [Rubroshorea leprosula]